MKTITIILGLVLFIDNIFRKYYVWHRIAKAGAKQSKSYFLYQLAQCQFCILFHVCTCLSLLYGWVTGFDLTIFLTPFVVSGILTTILKRQ